MTLVDLRPTTTEQTTGVAKTQYAEIRSLEEKSESKCDIKVILGE